MSTRYEGAAAQHTGIDWAKSGAEIGQDEVKPGEYALLFSYDELFYITGTVAGLRAFASRIDAAVTAVEAHAAAPLELSDFEPDEDGIYCCPRCETGFEPRDYPDLAAMIASITLHIETAHPVVTE